MKTILKYYKPPFRVVGKGKRYVYDSNGELAFLIYPPGTDDENPIKKEDYVKLDAVLTQELCDLLNKSAKEYESEVQS